VRLLKVIFLLGLICKGSLLPSMDLGGDCCPQEATEIECGSEEAPVQEKDGCCDTTVCDCLCCGHVFTFNSAEHLFFYPQQLITTTNSTYYFIYTFTFDDGIWQPPRQLWFIVL